MYPDTSFLPNCIQNREDRDQFVHRRNQTRHNFLFVDAKGGALSLGFNSSETCSHIRTADVFGIFDSHDWQADRSPFNLSRELIKLVYELCW